MLNKIKVSFEIHKALCLQVFIFIFLKRYFYWHRRAPPLQYFQFELRIIYVKIGSIQTRTEKQYRIVLKLKIKKLWEIRLKIWSVNYFKCSYPLLQRKCIVLSLIAQILNSNIKKIDNTLYFIILNHESCSFW